MNRIKFFTSSLSIIILLGFMVNTSAWGAATAEELTQQKVDIRKMANETLERLYKTQPSAKKAVESAAGYAVFSNFGTKIFLVGGGMGKGIAVNNKAKQETFMKVV